MRRFGLLQLRRRQYHTSDLRLAATTLLHDHGALGGTRTPTILLTATSRQRVYQFRHERLIGSARDLRRIDNGADVTNRGWGDKGCDANRPLNGCRAAWAASA